jgi:hypothetical protein
MSKKRPRVAKKARANVRPNLESVRAECARTTRVLGTLIDWMAQSANSPIRPDEAKTLLEQLADAPETGQTPGQAARTALKS